MIFMYREILILLLSCLLYASSFSDNINIFNESTFKIHTAAYYKKKFRSNAIRQGAICELSPNTKKSIPRPSRKWTKDRR